VSELQWLATTVDDLPSNWSASRKF